MTFPVVVLASGRGGTFAALVEAQRIGALPVAILALLADRRSAPVLEIAETQGVPAIALRPRDYPDRRAFDEALFARIEALAPQLVVLAGYMRIIDAGVVSRWAGRMINLHPSLLPKYPGLDTYAQALRAGDPTYGASVHYVTDQLDGGPLIARVELPVLAGDTPESLAERLQPVERALLVGVVGLIARGRIALGPAGVQLDGRPLAEPLKFDPAGGFAGL